MQKIKGIILFDIDGVIRDVTQSYRLSIQKTVNFFSGWVPTIDDIDDLKSEGIWNNDWDLSIELLKRNTYLSCNLEKIPTRDDLREKFDSYYFGENNKNKSWNGFINNEKLLVNKKFFIDLTSHGIKWGFVSGTEHDSAKFLLENRLSIKNAPLVAMGDAPEKPDPKGFLKLTCDLAKSEIDQISYPIAYVGDTVADVLTIKRAREIYPDQTFISFAVAPPHLHLENKYDLRKKYENKLKSSGADFILENTQEIINYVKEW